jgi:hypothetical protein
MTSEPTSASCVSRLRKGFFGLLRRNSKPSRCFGALLVEMWWRLPIIERLGRL